MSFVAPFIASAVSRVPWLPSVARQSTLFPVSRSARFYGFGKQALHGIIPASKHGIGYTGGAYLGYGVSNSVDPFGISKPKYKRSVQQSLKMPYGRYGYRRSYYRRRYRRYGRRYGYRRRSYYRRRYY